MIKKLQFTSLTIAAALFSFSATAADEMDIKAGFAFDMGFGVTALVNKQFYIMAGNDGLAADYMLKQGLLTSDKPVTYYVTAGAFSERKGGFGARLPFGLQLNFAEKWNSYAQIAPDLDFDGWVFGTQMAAGLRYSF